MQRGCLITIEGIEGAGKSTHIETIDAALRKRGIATVVTREPGGTALGEKLRDLLLANEDFKISAESELLMMFAARSEHITTVVRPALEDGRWVISDRFTDASYAYQGGGRRCSQTLLDTLNRFICSDIQPDLTFLLDISPSEAENRIINRGSKKDRFESEEPEFFERVRRAYLTLANENPTRWRIISANQEINQIKTIIINQLKTFLESKN